MDIAYDKDILIKPTSRVPMIGREYGYYTGPGNPLFSLGGGLIRSILYYILTKYHIRRGYYVVETPIIARTTLYELTGHLSFYRENMFLLDIEGDKYALKPMNCPYHVLIFMNLLERYGHKIRLPFKVFELGKVHRYEISGALKGLMRVRGFTQDDAHLFALEDQIMDLFLSVFQDLKDLYEKLFHMFITAESVKLRISLSERSKIGEDYMGSPEEWEIAEEKLMKMAEEIHRRYGIEFFAAEGEAAFYGPKLDIIALLPDPETGGKKEWQIGTMQFDFNLPRKFMLNKLLEKTHGVTGIYMIHRALLGSIERFLGVYLEAYQGRLPFVLSPIQIIVVGIKTGGDLDEEIVAKSRSIADELWSKGYRAVPVHADRTQLSGLIRRLRITLHPPVIVYIGEKELRTNTMSVSTYDFEARKYIKEQAGDIEELLGIVGRQEENIYELIGEAPKYQLDMSFLT